MNAAWSAFQVKGVLAKAFPFCKLEMLPLHLPGCFNVGKSDTGCGGSLFPEVNFQAIHLSVHAPEELGGSAGNVVLSSSLFLPAAASGWVQPSTHAGMCPL